MPELMVLDAASVKLIQEFLDLQRRQLANVPNRPAPFREDYPAPDVYIALTPAGGIPAMVGLTPGSASCTVFQQVNGVLVSIGVSQTVYNTQSKMPAGAYVPIVRDKFGTWYTLRSPGLSSCTAYTSQETDLRCEGGLLNLYNRTNTFTPDPTTGCLTRSSGPWTFAKTVACCDPSCLHIGTGTGTGTQRADICPCPTPNTHAPYCVTFAGVTSKDCDCTGMNVTVTLQPVGPAYLCMFQNTVYNATTVCFGSEHLHPQVTLQLVSGRWTLTVSFGYIMAVYSTPAKWRCDVPLTLALQTTNTTCATWPATVTVSSCSGHTGTGTGGGGTIQMLGVGFGSSNGAAVVSLSLSGVTVQAGILVVNINSTGGPPTATFNGVLMNPRFGTQCTFTFLGASVTVYTSQFWVAVMAGTHDIVATTALPGAMQMNAINDTGLTSNINDVGAFSNASNSINSPDSGLSPNTTAANEAVHGTVAGIGGMAPSDWASGLVDGGQGISDIITVGGGNFGLFLGEGRRIASAIGTFRANLSSADSSWNAAVETYK